MTSWPLVICFAYDVENCYGLHLTARLTDGAAKFPVSEFAMSHLCGPAHGLKPEVLMRMLPWQSEPKRISGAAP
jgi:hypothetical protein